MFDTKITELTTGQLWITLLFLIITVIGAIMVVKISITFDWNKYLERKDEKLKAKIMNACTHLELSVTQNNEVAIKGFFISPSGISHWYCERCGLQKSNDNREEMMELAQYYIKNPKEYVKQEKKFQTLLKKAGIN
jgi:uncharacterized protein YxeA